MPMPDAEPTQRWPLFITPRAEMGLRILCLELCSGSKLSLLLHAIGSGCLTVVPKRNIELAKIVSQQAIDNQRELSIRAFKGDRQALLQQQAIPTDLESRRVSIVIEYTVRYILVDIAARLNAVPHPGSQTTSVSSLLKSIGHGDMSLIDIVDPAVRLKYLRNTKTVKEYLACRRIAKEQDALAAKTI